MLQRRAEPVLVKFPVLRLRGGGKLPFTIVKLPLSAKQSRQKIIRAST
jgi:hypothetical protein